MSDRLETFLWLLDDDTAERSTYAQLDRPALWVVPGVDREQELDPPVGPDEVPSLLKRMQDLFAAEPVGSYPEDAQVWRRMAASVILAIGVGMLVALGAGIAFAHL